MVWAAPMASAEESFTLSVAVAAARDVTKAASSIPLAPWVTNSSPDVEAWSKVAQVRVLLETAGRVPVKRIWCDADPRSAPSATKETVAPLPRTRPVAARVDKVRSPPLWTDRITEEPPPRLLAAALMVRLLITSLTAVLAWPCCTRVPPVKVTFAVSAMRPPTAGLTAEELSKRRVAPGLTVTAVEAASAPSAPESARIPLVTVVAPVWLATAWRSRVPAPALVRANDVEEARVRKTVPEPSSNGTV